MWSSVRNAPTLAAVANTSSHGVSGCAERCIALCSSACESNAMYADRDNEYVQKLWRLMDGSHGGPDAWPKLHHVVVQLLLTFLAL